MSEHATSTSLIRRVKSRDDDAWVQLVSVYGPTVYGWCRVRGLDEHDAGDLVQTVFLTHATSPDHRLHSIMSQHSVGRQIEVTC
jgi:DNA-directed RNA polymerase specialized sigma24 family protein